MQVCESMCSTEVAVDLLQGACAQSVTDWQIVDQAAVDGATKCTESSKSGSSNSSGALTARTALLAVLLSISWVEF